MEAAHYLKDSRRTWTVVQFVKDGTVEAVPSNWLEGHKCYWPPLKKSKLLNAIKNTETPRTTWDHFSVKLFNHSNFDDYAKARRKAKAAEDTSDLQSEIDQTGALKKRRISRPPRFNNDDESSSDCTLSVLPSPPRQRTNSKIVTAINEDVGSPSLLANIGGERRRQQHHEAINSHYSHADNEESLDMAEQSIVRNQEAGHSKEGLETLLQSMKNIEQQGHLFRALLTDVLQEVKDLKEDVRQLKEAGNKIAAGEDHRERVPFLQRFSPLKFPLNTDEEFSTFENILNSGEQFQDGVQELYKIGGENVYQFVKRVLSTLITNNLALTYSWLGRKGKKPFSTLNIANLVICAAEKVRVCATRREAEIAIQMWLKRAADRIAARLNKNL
ncbi:uncharacterized protein LOC143216543 [Lasioglossum baleicum]|uniref:uncharacterized protein LOC143216543 n=1 Tax=Lasioglossum baleicum TaxID=434251 RepID=UPI003FCDF5FB